MEGKLAGPLFTGMCPIDLATEFPKHHCFVNVMVNFMCQFDWTLKFSYLVKHYSRCPFKSVFVMTIIGKLGTLVTQMTLHSMNGPCGHLKA